MVSWKLAVIIAGVPLVMTKSAHALESVVIPTNPFQKPHLNVETDSALNSCAQFAGEWQGSCDGIEGKKDLQLKIDQTECTVLSVDGQMYPIDGMESAASNQGVAMTNGSTSLTWDSDKSRIIGNTQAIGQVLGKRRTLKYQYKSKFTLEKDRMALLIKTEAQADTFVNDFKKADKTESTCRLEKKTESSKIK